MPSLRPVVPYCCFICSLMHLISLNFLFLILSFAASHNLSPNFSTITSLVVGEIMKAVLPEVHLLIDKPDPDSCQLSSLSILETVMTLLVATLWKCCFSIDHYVWLLLESQQDLISPEIQKDRAVLMWRRDHAKSFKRIWCVVANVRLCLLSSLTHMFTGDCDVCVGWILAAAGMNWFSWGARPGLPLFHDLSLWIQLDENEIKRERKRWNSELNVLFAVCL